MGARPVPAPLEVRPRCGLRAIAQRAVPARLRAHVIARVVGTGAVVGGWAEAPKKVERGIIVFPPLIAPTFCRSFVGLKGDDSRLLAFTLQWKREVLSHVNSNSAIVLSKKLSRVVDTHRYSNKNA